MIFGLAQVKIVDLRRENQLYTIFGSIQAEFSLYAILGLHSAFGNITPRITESSL